MNKKSKYNNYKNKKSKFNNHKKTYNKSVNVITETFDDDEFREEVTCPCTVADVYCKFFCGC